MPTDSTRNERQRRWREKRREEKKQSYTIWLENETVECLKRLMEKYEHKADQMITTALQELEAQDKRKQQEEIARKEREQREQKEREEQIKREIEKKEREEKEEQQKIEKERQEKIKREQKKQAEKEQAPQKLDDEARNRLIEEIQEMKKAGMNFTQIASKLKENETPTQSGKGAWNRKMVSRLLAKA